MRGGRYVNETKGFTVSLPAAAAWSIDTAGQPDLFLRHARRRAGISINATCGTVPPDRPVDIVSRHLLFGIRNKHILRQDRRVMSGHEALEVVLRGELRDQDLVLHGYTVKNSHCVYDLVLVAVPEDYWEVDEDFETVVRGFRLSRADAR